MESLITIVGIGVQLRPESVIRIVGIRTLWILQPKMPAVLVHKDSQLDGQVIPTTLCLLAPASVDSDKFKHLFPEMLETGRLVPVYVHERTYRFSPK